jgi:hypothetical protein
MAVSFSESSVDIPCTRAVCHYLRFATARSHFSVVISVMRFLQWIVKEGAEPPPVQAPGLSSKRRFHLAHWAR